ncbi:DUF6099 family protein [Streptacidiphilus jiangxiensis]|uniref:Uncharacterized protein n=1 Tax=Streptacidiphilus jiangxiensis TaxID=235985 RepID=A0A1H7KV64_STRJI|nr:DUF6099 family protein [Streptacidiphilus jiangxiensis]SEK90699.1 hypothetical protein SAMN05414137_104219 [Streptacidiphilus jiangxiensis]
MDALRLIRTTRHALAEARSAADVTAEAWQACRVTEAVALTAALALTERALEGGTGCGPVEVARALAEAAAHAAECVGRPPDEPVTGDRAARLSALADPVATVRELRVLLREACQSLLVVALGADEQSLYWCCVDGVDAAFEARELATELMRALGAEPAQLAGSEEPRDLREPPQVPEGVEPARVRVGIRVEPPPG